MFSLKSYLIARVYDLTMRKTERVCLREWRAALLRHARGTVLEIGGGTGINLRHYPTDLQRLVLSEPDRDMRSRLKQALDGSDRRNATLAEFGAEAIDFPSESFDSIVSTLVLCSVDDPSRCLREIHRLLRPGGVFLFIEHVAATENPRLAKWQRRFEPVWAFCCGNCHLTRNTGASIAQAGFSFDRLDRLSMTGVPPIVRPAIRGIARKQDRHELP